MQASAKVLFLRELTMFRCSRRTPEGADYDLPFVAQRVQIVGPRLHHLSPLRKIFGEVVRRANAVPFPMRKLPFNGVPRPALLVQERGRHAAKTVDCHLVAGVAQILQCEADGVLADRPPARRTRKQIWSAPCHRLELPQDRQAWADSGTTCACLISDGTRVQSLKKAVATAAQRAGLQRAGIKPVTPPTPSGTPSAPSWPRPARRCGCCAS